MKKFFGLTLATALIASPFFGSSASATTSDELTSNYEIDWEKAWANQSNYNSVIDFGTDSSNSAEGTGISAAATSFKNLATGTTSLAKSTTDNTVTSTGKTTGKNTTTNISATTSLKRGSTLLGQSSKKVSVGKITATAKFSVTHRSFTGTTPYAGLTIHTATDSGILYDAATTESANY